MKTPRLALLAFLALAPAIAAADPGWTPKVQPGESWTAVKFENESKEAKHYWFRSDAKGDAIPLYILIRKANPSVKDSVYYESVASGYVLKIIPSPRSYVIIRPGTKLTYAGTPAGSLGASAWDATHKPTFRPDGKTRTNPYRAGTITVVVAAPTGAAEKLDSTPISVFTPGLAPVTWDEYYYTRAPEKPSWGGLRDPDGDYRQAKLTYADMHARVLPFEYLFDSDKCFVRPEACADGKKPEHKRFIEAASEAAKGNLLLIEPLAVESHKYYADEARKFKAELDAASADKFSEPENKLLQRLLVDNARLADFQKELRGLKPEQQPLFVKKWRSYLKAEIDVYLSDSEKAGNKAIDQAAIRKAMTDRLNKAVALPLGSVVASPNKPGEPGKPGKPGTPAKPENRPLTKKDAAKLWANQITAIGDWHAIQTSKLPLAFNLSVPLPSLTFYCYHHEMGKDKSLAEHLRKWPLIVECVNWSVPKDDATQGEALKKFKVRGNIVQFDLAYVDGKLTTVNGLVGVTVTELKALPDTLGGEKFVKVTAPQSPAVATLPLSPAEQTWLDKRQANLYTTKMPAEPAAIKTHIEANRKAVAENLEPNADAISKYQAAARDPKATAAAIDGALPPEVWGGNVNSIVASSGANLEIQLSPEEYEALKKKPADLKIYEDARGGADGDNGDHGKGTFDKGSYDPIVLHRTVMAARKALGAAPTAPVAKPEGDASTPPLNGDELKLLTPAERQVYDKLLENVKNKVPGAELSLGKESFRLRKLIADEKRGESPAYAPPKDLEAFKKLPNWHKDIFCDPKSAGMAAAAADNAAAPIDNRPDAMAGLNTTEKGLTTPKPTGGNVTAPTGSLPDWAKGPCAQYLASKTQTTPGGGTNPDSGIGNLGGPKKTGPDANPKPKEPNTWITRPLLQTGAKGALIGILIGSLFGPVGLIAGPLIGAAFFYGLKKYDDAKAKKEE